MKPKVMVPAAVLLVVLAFGVASWLTTTARPLWRTGIEINDAFLWSSDVIDFVVSSCHQQPQVDLLRETEDEVHVKVSIRYILGGSHLECQDAIVCRLKEPLAARLVIDKHTGTVVAVGGPADTLPPHWSQLRGSLTPCGTLG